MFKNETDQLLLKNGQFFKFKKCFFCSSFRAHFNLLDECLKMPCSIMYNNTQLSHVRTEIKENGKKRRGAFNIVSLD